MLLQCSPTAILHHDTRIIIFLFSLVDVSTLNLPSSDTLSIIERDHVTRADALTASDLNGLNPNALATEQQPPLTRANAHDYGQDTGSSFAMQSEDFPALPGSQLTAPDVFGREDCAITEHACSPRKSSDKHSRTKFKV